jgi:hypothetical protein
MAEVNTDEDRYLTLREVCDKIVQEADRFGERVERVEINVFANGDATFRVWPPRAEEPDGGYLPGPESG